MAFSYENSHNILFSSQEAMYQASLGRPRNRDGEISVFSAERYFSDALDDITARKGKKEQHTKYADELMEEVHGMKPKTAIPSISTEASWNSRRVLLPLKQRQQRKGIGKIFLSALCCADKSIEIEENLSDNKSYMKEDETVSRSRIEVYGPSLMNKEDIALNLEKRLAMLTWDANPRLENTARVRRVVRSDPSDDIDSDSSSELFEIKSLSSKGPRLFRHQDSSNTSPTINSNVANFSVASYKTSGIKKCGPSILLGCRRQGAVNVVEAAQKLPEKKSTAQNQGFKRTSS